VVDKDDGTRGIERVVTRIAVLVARIAVLVSSKAVLVRGMTGRADGEARHAAGIARDIRRKADLTRRKDGDTESRTVRSCCKAFGSLDEDIPGCREEDVTARQAVTSAIQPRS
jgi:hypothetical protein